MKANAYQDLVWDKLMPFYKAVTNEDTFKQLQLTTLTLDLCASAGEIASIMRTLTLEGEMHSERAREIILSELEYTLAVVTCVAKFLGCPLERLMTTSADNFK